MRVGVGAKSAGAGSTTLPLMSVYGVASSGCALREIGVFNTTTTALDVKLVRLTTAGTQGSALTENQQDGNLGTPLCQAFNTHTVAPTLGADCGYRASLGAAIGSNVIWTFGDRGLVVPAGTANGIGVIVENGTGQICQIYFIWDE